MYKVYQVEVNDTIEDVARKFGTTVNELRNINSISDITPGELIVVPSNSIFDIYVVKKGDNIYEISRRYGIDMNTLLKINGLDQDDFIYPNQELLVPKNNVTIYVTNENDTLNKVADMLGSDVMSLIEQNQEILLFPEQLIVKTR